MVRPRLLVPVLATFVVTFAFASLSSAQTFTWSRWPMPFPRYDHVAVYDPIHERMVVNGGVSATEPDAGDSRETWSLALDGPPRWEVLPAADIPRSRSIATYDPPGDRMVVFGGVWDGYRLSGTEQLKFAGGWSGGFSGTSPPAGDFSVVAYDGLRRRMLAYPWQAHVVCQLDLATNVWSTFSTTGPIPSFVVSMTHDVTRDRLIARESNGIWQLALSGTPTWSQLATSGTPPPDAGGHLFFDALRDRILQVRGDGTVWALSMDATPTWSSIANPPLPTGPHNPQIVHDEPRDRLLWFGSSSTNDTWAFRLQDATWYLVEPGSPIPVLKSHTAVAAPPWDALVVFGGSLTNTLWRFPLSGGGRFVQVATAGPTPSARSGHAAIYDPVRQRMIVFGGSDGTQYLNDVHALTIGPTPTWSPVFSQNSPPSVRLWSHAIYDPVRDRMVVLGGTNGSTVFRDLVALTLDGTPTWISLAPDAALPVLEYTDLAYDKGRDRLIAIGKTTSDTRAWWTPAGGPYVWTEFAGTLSERREFAAAYDPAGDRVLLHGGYSAGNPQTFNQLCALNLSTGQWSEAPAVTLARYGHTLTFDPSRQRFALFGGWEQLPGFSPYTAYSAGSVWFAHDPQTVLDVKPPTGAGGRLAFRRLWLAAPDRIAFELEGAGEVASRVEAFDVAGRLLGATTLPAGSRSGAIVLAAAARPGVVVARVRQGATLAASRRLAVLQ